MTDTFSAESRLIHASTERVPRPVPVDLRDLAAVERELTPRT
jgi:hypothetical protein